MSNIMTILNSEHNAFNLHESIPQTLYLLDSDRSTLWTNLLVFPCFATSNTDKNQYQDLTSLNDVNKHEVVLHLQFPGHLDFRCIEV